MRWWMVEQGWEATPVAGAASRGGGDQVPRTRSFGEVDAVTEREPA